MSTSASTPSDATAQYSAFERSDEPRLSEGRVVGRGRYRVRRELAMGGMAVVYEAEDLRSGRVVALKVVRERLAQRADTLERYRNEARLAAALSRHPNVVSPIDHGRLPELDDRPYLVTDLVRGQPLGAALLESPRGMEIERVIPIARDLALALDALHQRGIVHRDVKPGNVVLERSEDGERARLLDFGCAYALGTDEVEASTDLTEAHERVGTAIYMAPEQAVGLRPTPSFDLYAFGATIYELLVGAPPYAGASKDEVVARKCAPNDPPRPVERLRSDVPPALAELVDRCLAREAEDRPASAAEVVAELDALARSLGIPLRAVASSERSEPTSSAQVIEGPAGSTEADGEARGRWGAWVLVLILVLVGGGLAVALAGERPRRPTGSGDEEGISVAGGAGEAGDAAVVDASGARGTTGTTETTDGVTDTTAGPSSGSSGGAEAPASTTTGPDDGGHPAADEGSSPAPTPRPSTPRWATAECTSLRDAAVESRAQRRWSDLLSAVTEHRRCWKSRDDRLLLHVAALVGLGRYEECARLAAGSRNRQIQRMAKQCEHKLESSP